MHTVYLLLLLLLMSVYLCCYFCHCFYPRILLLCVWYISVYLDISAAISVQVKGGPRVFFVSLFLNLSMYACKCTWPNVNPSIGFNMVGILKTIISRDIDFGKPSN